jgi:type VI secretion system secreted protein Hcp
MEQKQMSFKRIGFILLGMLFWTLPALGVIETFLKIEGVEGESKDKEHTNEIDVLSFSWGLTQSTSTHAGTGGATGKVSFGDITVIKNVDSASPLLVLRCCEGKHFPEAILTFRKTGEHPYDILKITLEDVIISHIDIVGSVGDSVLQEQVGLNFAKITFEYFTQKPDGTSVPGDSVIWDIRIDTGG